MEIERNENGCELTLALTGRLDTITASQLDDELAAIPESVTSLILDFGGIDYISSAGLRVILAGHKTMSKRGSMKLHNVDEAVMDVFEMTGFSSILAIE